MKVTSILSSIILVASISNAQIVNYDIPAGQCINMAQTTGDICSAPWNVEELRQNPANSGTWGFTWSSTNSGIPTSIDVTIGFTVTDGGGNFTTTLNGSASFNVTDGTAKDCENSTMMTWSVDPTNYASMGVNTFMINLGNTDSIQVDNLPFAGDPYIRVTVDYTPCSPPDSTITQNQNILTSNAANASYQWIDCETGLIIFGETNVSFSPTSNGEYGVVVTDLSSGCSDTSECITVATIGISELEAAQLNIYPNPAQHELNISLTGFEGSTRFSMYTVQGRLVKQIDHLITRNTPISIDISNLAKGQYQIIALSDKKIASVRFAKE